MKVERLSIHAVDLATSEQSENMQERAGKLYAVRNGNRAVEIKSFGNTYLWHFGRFFWLISLIFWGEFRGGNVFPKGLKKG